MEAAVVAAQAATLRVCVFCGYGRYSNSRQYRKERTMVSCCIRCGGPVSWDSAAVVEAAPVGVKVVGGFNNAAKRLV